MTARTAGVTLLPATAIVVGNMVGTGIFTSLGFQVADIQSGFVLMVLWILGGVFALCGASCYGELAAPFALDPSLGYQCESTPGDRFSKIRAEPRLRPLFLPPK